MSDEPRMIRAGVQAARDRRTVPSFNDDIGDAIERDALAALDRLESQNQALQERAEKAEALLLRLHGWDIMDVTSDGPYWQREIDQLLSPTQETDEPDCTRCGNERTVGGYGTDERFPCPVCRPTQETDPE